ncbi:MAG: hypothetical protein ABL907_06395 [Hyphomicrobium sp.]
MGHVDRERARSLRFVQIVFALLAIASLFAALSVAYSSDKMGLPESSAGTIAVAFLCVGVMNTGLLFLWERIFKDIST